MSKFRMRSLPLVLLICSCATDTNAETAVYLMDGEQTPDKFTSQRLVENKDYFTVTIRTMRLYKNRVGLNRYYASVYGNFDFLYKGSTTEIVYVTDPSKFSEVDAKNQHKIAYFNQPLLGPIPYKGGRIDAEIGLFAIKSTDLSEPYLSLLNKAATTIGNPSIAAALPFVGLIKDGITVLTGSNGPAILQAAYDSEWATPRTGYYVVVQDSRQELPKDKLKIISSGVPGDVLLADTNDKPITGVSYTIFSVTKVQDHDYWIKLPGIFDTYEEMYELLGKGKEKEAREALAALRRTILTTWEIHTAHAKRIVKDITNDFEDKAAAIGFSPGSVKNLTHYWPKEAD